MQKRQHSIIRNFGIGAKLYPNTATSLFQNKNQCQVSSNLFTILLEQDMDLGALEKPSQKITCFTMDLVTIKKQAENRKVKTNGKESMTHKQATYTIATILGIIIGLWCVQTADAHHATKPETKAQAVFRDRQAVRRCMHFRSRGASPSRKICVSLLAATHRVRYHGRKANRTWVYDRHLLKIMRHESGFTHRAVNSISGACGLGQMLPCHKYGKGSCWPRLREQANCFVRYILGRYGTPANAWAHWMRYGWY